MSKFLIHFLILAVLVSGESPASAASKMPVDLELTILSVSELSNLTTEALSDLDPGQPNAHLRRWVISRKMEITDWKSRKIPGGFVGVQGGVMRAAEVSALRPPGAWYNRMAQFPCAEKDVDPAFETEEGAKQQAREALRLWDEALSKSKVSLSILLSKVAAVSEKSASLKADRVFQEWLNRLDREWREQVSHDVIPKQWKAYEQQAIEAGYCTSQHKTTSTSEPLPSPDSWMDSVGTNATPQLLVHVPSRRWHGFYAVRADMGAGSVDLLLQMLIDPATPRSVISPDAISAQGPSPELFEIPEAMPMLVKIEAGSGQSGLGKVAAMSFAKLSGYPIALTRYLYSPTALFDEPDYFAPCCAGVFGKDLLRRYPIEFLGGKASAIQLWKVQGFKAPADYSWAELRENAQGELRSVCSERVKKLNGAAKICEDPRVAIENSVANIYLDLPHGKIWFSPEELAAPDFKNLSGIKLIYGYQSAQRVLEVSDIGQTSIANELKSVGFKKGVIVTDVDGIPASEMDLWEVNRHLSGVYGGTVRLKWKSSLAVKTFREDSFQTPNAVRQTGNGH